ncbi:hypothetical protein FPOA_03423 [Fusarium poae]|uniref:Uncharacterized protein n=1 Tax=Fusarium poae TaxID=36050 RepID=A0A1B8B9T7_FUSPO|nr:hypothetical protein FPOA_03423 [Fusarium poae]
MCVEIIALAVCRPVADNDQDEYCGKFHLVAGGYNVCKEARSDFIGHFGTCGEITAEAPATFTLSDTLKFPCIPCATEMDKRLKDHKNLEPHLVKGSPLHEEYLEQKSKGFEATGHEHPTHPHHAEGSVTKGKAAVHEPAKAHVVALVRTKLITVSAPAGTPFVEVANDMQGSGQSAATDVSEKNEEESAPAADSWTGAPIATEPVTDESAITEPPFEKDDETTVVTNNNDGETSVKAGSDTGDDHQKGVEGDTAPITRRPVDFKYSAETADKLRDTTEKFASLKSGFLAGKSV